MRHGPGRSDTTSCHVSVYLQFAAPRTRPRTSTETEHEHDYHPTTSSIWEFYLSRPKVAGAAGLLSRTFSISSMTSGVSLGSRSSALTLSSICMYCQHGLHSLTEALSPGLTCATLVAPKITVLTFSFLTHHASDNCVTLPPSLSATSVNFLTLAIFALPSSLCSCLMVPSKKLLLVAKRESSGMPSLYLPVRRPEARGDQMVVPYWNWLKRGAYSTSNRWRWKALY